MGRTRCTGRPQATGGGDTPIPPPLPDANLQRHALIDDAIHEARWREQRRSELRRAILVSAVLLTITVWFIAGMRLLTLAAALLLVGPLVGVAIHRLSAGRFLCGLLGAVGYAVCMPTSYGYGLMAWLVLGAPVTFLLFAVVGVRRESRALVGWE